MATTKPSFASLSSLAAAALMLLAAGASAQGLYRSVGADGRVTYSDRAPAEANGKFAVERRSATPAAASSVELPYVMREVGGRYPVTLYAAPDCTPCATARALLAARGIPFSEKTVSSNEDITALKALSGDASLPFATVGSQPLHGFSEQEWQRLLDAAGYPKTSQLPANWRAAAATPLVQIMQAQPSAATAQRAEAAAPVRPSSTASRSNAAGNSNPAGIRF